MRAERIATSVYQFVLFILTWAITFSMALIIVPGIHESGHAGACLIEGGTVTQWRPFAFGAEPHTACNAQLAPFFCAAGSLTSVVAWLLCTYVFSRRAALLGTGHLRNFVAALWFWWSFWVFGELFMDTIHAYSDVPLHHDAVRSAAKQLANRENGRKGGLAKSRRKTLACRRNARLPRVRRTKR